MKTAIFILVILLTGCCLTKYDLVYHPPSSIQMNMDYHSNGFAAEDTLFKISSLEYGSNFNFSYTNFSMTKSDSTKTMIFNNILGTEKIFIESLLSNYKDTLFEIGYNSKRKQIGNKRCGRYNTTYFNTHAVYKGQYLSSGENSTLEINVTR